MNAPRRILLIRPSALGDVCRTVPLLVSLRRAWPGATIDWLVHDAWCDAVRSHPDLDEAVPFPRHDLAGWWRSPATARAARAWIGDLRRRAYDLVLDAQGLGRSGLIARLTGAPVRVGLRSAREGAWLGYTIRHPVPRGMHTVDEMLALLEPLGVEAVADMRLHPPPEALRDWSDDRAARGIDGPYAVLAPTTRWPGKRWPAERWRTLAAPLRRRGIAHLLVIGAPLERDQVAPLLEGAAGVIDLVGATSIGGTMAVIAGAEVVVASDSAPLHMAVGLGRPCVGLFGPTDPARVGPYRRPGAVVAAPGAGTGRFKDRAHGEALMRAIEVDAVLERVDAERAAAPATDPVA